MALHLTPQRARTHRRRGAAARILVVGLVSMLLLSWVRVAPVAHADVTSTIVNFTSGGSQVVRYDTRGHAIDAHDGEIHRFGTTYYLYGTTYTCGFQWQTSGSLFCGYKSYSSTDLVNWTDNGLLFDARTATWQARCANGAGGCFRPHVIYNATTAQYVLWINTYDTGAIQNYRVFVSASPTGPFTERPLPVVAVNPNGAPGAFNNGDEDLFVDDNGTAYMVYTNIVASHSLLVEKLNAQYDLGTGQYSVLNTANTEAPMMFKRNGVYYVMYGDPTCAYCGGTGTSYKTSSTPLGPWTYGTTGSNGSISSTSCGGQPTHVALLPTSTGTMYLFQSDLWHGGFRNEGRANYFWGPLSFNADNSIQPLVCSASFQTTLTGGAPGSAQLPANLDQSSGAAGFAEHCDIGGGWQRLQTFMPATTGVLTSIAFNTFQSGASSGVVPNADLILDVVNISAGVPAGVIKSFTIMQNNSVGFSAREVLIQPNIDVTANQTYGLLARSAATTGCYGFNYSDTNPYSRGQESYSSNGGGAFTAETSRDLRFETTVVAGSGGTVVDQNNGTAAFNNYNDIRGPIQRLQTFTAGGTTLPRIDVWTYRTGSPAGDLVIKVVTLDASNNPVTTLYQQSVAPASVSTTPGLLTIMPGLSGLTAGTRYGLLLATPATPDNGLTNAYGWAYNDSNVYSGGIERFSSTSGSSWSTEANRSLKFVTYKGGGAGGNLALGKTVISSSSYEGPDWGVSRATDGTNLSVPGGKGYTSANVAAADVSASPIWVEVDLGANQSISRVKLYPRSDYPLDGSKSPGFPVNFTIQVAPSGGAYTTVKTVTNQANPLGLAQEYTFAATSARKVRVQATLLGLPAAPEEATSYRLQFAEIEVGP